MYLYYLPIKRHVEYIMIIAEKFILAAQNDKPPLAVAILYHFSFIVAWKLVIVYVKWKMW